MNATSSSAVSGKTPFTAIHEAEEIAAKRIAEEKTALDDEFENARERNQRYEEDKRNERTQHAREELKQEKAAMGRILSEHEAAAAKECAALDSQAKGKMRGATELLKKAFLSLDS